MQDTMQSATPVVASSTAPPSAPHDIVFLIDVDNTLLDNDGVIHDLREYLLRAFGNPMADHYWTIFEELRSELGYADYLGALQRYRVRELIDPMNDARMLAMSAFLIDYPFIERLYPDALAAIKHLQRLGTTVILSDGDVVFQPRKVQRSGLWEAVDGNVLIYIHKELMLEAVQQHYPARHYVMVDDKLRILAAMKASLGDKLTTIFVRQGHYALDPASIVSHPPADITLECIGDLVKLDVCSRIEPGRVQRNLYLKGIIMNANTRKLHDVGQSVWLDNITRDLLTSGTLARYIDELSVTGLTSNPSIFEQAIGSGTAYDDQIERLAAKGLKSEALFFELAIQDLTVAADLFRSIFDATQGVDGWVSLEVSPLLANDTAATVKVAASLHARAARPNLFIKIPGTQAGIAAIEESIFAGIPVNVTLLFSRDQYLAAAYAYMRGIQRRIDAGLDPKVESVASLFVSRWDVSVAKETPPPLHNRLGIAVAMRTYNAYRELLLSESWRKLEAAGAHPQRLLWASTGTKDPDARDTLYVEALVAPNTVNTMPEKTLLAFADHGIVGECLAFDGGASEDVIEEFRHASVDDTALAARLQREGGESFNKSWNALIASLEEKISQKTK